MSLIPPSYLPYIYDSGLVFGTVPIIIGVNALANPELGGKILGFASTKTTGTQQEKSIIHGLIKFFGIRDLALGLIMLNVWYHGRGSAIGDKIAGSTLIVGGLVAALDGVVSKSVVPGSEWNHWSFAPIGFGLGAALLRWI